jgi:formylglycine-generating enzyme required for sulfatase activity
MGTGHTATITGFCLDKYEVTVGRFQAFVADFDNWLDTVEADDGEHPLISGSGWNAGWSDFLPASTDDFDTNWALDCTQQEHTWAYSPGNGTFPINCVNWYEAFAFCLWDGGRLPTEAEWEYAASGGDANRQYPWGNNQPSPLPANYASNHHIPFLTVGSEPDGRGRWGHLDLAGSMREWNLDWYEYPFPIYPCVDCAVLTDGGHGRVVRGGGWESTYTYLRAVYRSGESPDLHSSSMGFRCVHDAN